MERNIGYGKCNALKGRKFDSLEESNAFLRQWNKRWARTRIHGTTKQQPFACFEQTERAVLLPLPDQPYEVATWKRVKLHRDCYVVFENAYYSAPFRYVGQTVLVRPAEQAYDYVAGYMVANDVSARDVQFSDKQWIRGKSFDTFCPTGPYLLTADEVEDPHNLGIRCWVNGELRQNSNTFEMIFKIPELLAFISRTSTLLPGDIIVTGTPDGVGEFRDPQVFLKSGDVVEIEIDRLGRLQNTVK